MSETRIRIHLNAPPSAVYRALTDPEAVRRWMVPAGMTSEVEAWDAREGGSYRITLTYDEDTGTGKSSSRSDTHHGRFVALVPDEAVAWTSVFETPDPAFQGEMTIRFALAPADGGTDLLAIHAGVPAGVRPEDNELGWQSSLSKLGIVARSFMS